MKNPTPYQVASAYEAQMDALQDKIESEYERQADAFDAACSAMEQQIRDDPDLVTSAIVDSYDDELTEKRYDDLNFRLVNARQDAELLLIVKDLKTLADDAVKRYAEVLVRQEKRRF